MRHQSRAMPSLYFALAAVQFFCAAPVDAAGCTVAIRNGDAAALSSVGGGIDAPQFKEYSIQWTTDGQLVVFDPLASRLLQFDSRCRYLRSIVLEEADPVSTVAIVGNQLYGMTATGHVKRVLDLEGIQPPSRQGPGEQFAPGSVDSQSEAEAVLQNTVAPLADRRGVFLNSQPKLPGEIGLVPADNRRLLADGIPVRGADGVLYKYTFESSTTRSGKLVVRRNDVPIATAALVVRGAEALGAVEVSGIRADGATALTAETFSVNPRGEIRVALNFLILDQSGNMVASGRYAYPVPANKSKGRPTVNPVTLKAGTRSTFVVPLVTSGGLALREVDLEQGSPASRVALKDPSTSEGGDRWLDRESVPTDASRAAILMRAEAYLTLEWKALAATLAPAGQPKCQASATGWQQPYFLRKVPAQTTVFGVPYSWGSKEDLATIAGRLKTGAVAGNVCCLTYKNPRTGKLHPTWREDATGIDCSGFVSRAWDLKDKKGKDIGAGTATLPEYAAVLTDPRQLRPGDAISRSGDHVRLFVGWTTAPVGLRIRAYESTTDSLCSGVCERDLPVRMYHDYALLGAKAQN